MRSPTFILLAVDARYVGTDGELGFLKIGSHLDQSGLKFTMYR